MAASMSNTPTPVTSRRPLAAAVLATVGAAFVPPAVAEIVTIGRQDQDAEVIALCAQFDAIEHEYRAALDSAEATPGREATVDALAAQAMQAPLLDRICKATCTTPAAIVALASSLVLWDAELHFQDDDPEAFTNERLIGALLRAVFAGRA